MLRVDISEGWEIGKIYVVGFLQFGDEPAWMTTFRITETGEVVPVPSPTPTPSQPPVVVDVNAPGVVRHGQGRLREGRGVEEGRRQEGRQVGLGQEVREGLHRSGQDRFLTVPSAFPAR